MKDENKSCSILHCKLYALSERRDKKAKRQKNMSWMIAAERDGKLCMGTHDVHSRVTCMHSNILYKWPKNCTMKCLYECAHYIFYTLYVSTQIYFKKNCNYTHTYYHICHSFLHTAINPSCSWCANKYIFICMHMVYIFCIPLYYMHIAHQLEICAKIDTVSTEWKEFRCKWVSRMCLKISKASINTYKSHIVLNIIHIDRY